MTENSNGRKIQSDTLMLVSTIVETLVPETGVEPARLAAADFKSAVSTNFTTQAY